MYSIGRKKAYLRTEIQDKDRVKLVVDLGHCRREEILGMVVRGGLEIEGSGTAAGAGSTMPRERGGPGPRQGRRDIGRAMAE